MARVCLLAFGALLAIAVTPALAQCPAFTCTAPNGGTEGMYINCQAGRTYVPMEFVTDPPFVYVFGTPQIKCTWADETPLPLSQVQVKLGFTCPGINEPGTPFASPLVSPCGSEFVPAGQSGVAILRQPGFTVSPSPSPTVNPCPPGAGPLASSCNSISNPTPARRGGFLACVPGATYPAGTLASAFPIPPMSPNRFPLDCGLYPLTEIVTQSDFTCSTTGGGLPRDRVRICSTCSPSTCTWVVVNPLVASG